MPRIVVSLMVLLWTSLLFAADVGPQSFQVERDWKKVHESDTNCKEFFHVRSIRVIGKDVMSDIQVDYLVEIRGDWSEHFVDKPKFPSGPCFGVKREEGAQQTIRKNLSYRKYGNAWTLYNWFAAERHY